jgi:hypothetical protein
VQPTGCKAFAVGCTHPNDDAIAAARGITLSARRSITALLRYHNRSNQIFKPKTTEDDPGRP